MRPNCETVRRALVFVAVVTFCASLGEASLIRPVNLEQMTARADRIFSGRCVSVHAARDPELGQMVTYATFKVERAVKGEIRGAVTIKMLGAEGSGAVAGRGVDGLPRFRKGEEVILFLYGDSARGLTSPVGFGQGKFVLIEDKEGRRLAINQFGNRNLFRDLSPETEHRLGASAKRWRGRGGVPPDALLDAVRLMQE